MTFSLTQKAQMMVKVVNVNSAKIPSVTIKKEQREYITSYKTCVLITKSVPLHQKQSYIITLENQATLFIVGSQKENANIIKCNDNTLTSIHNELKLRVVHPTCQIHILSSSQTLNLQLNIIKFNLLTCSTQQPKNYFLNL